jgi:hypothetical protein
VRNFYKADVCWLGMAKVSPSSSSLNMKGDSDADWTGDAPERESITGNRIPFSLLHFLLSEMWCGSIGKMCFSIAKAKYVPNCHLGYNGYNVVREGQ